MATKDEVRRVSIYINGSESELTLKELTRGSAKLRNELAGLVPGTEAFIKKAEELRQVNTILQEIRADVNGVDESFNSLKDGIDNVKNILLAGFSLDAIIDGMKEVIAQNALFSDNVADVQKTTGLTQASVIHLNEELKKVDTRTAQEELLGLATVAGKLGISAEKDVLAFVKAADQISVALGEDLGGAEEAVNELGKLTDIFKIKDEFGLEQSLLKTGSAINELGAIGTANEGFLVAFAARLAGIAPAAEISIQNVLGLGAIFDEFSQPVEASATAIGQFIVGLGADTQKFADIAKMSKSSFEQLLGRDGNAALIKVLENVKSTGLGVQGLAESMGMVGEDGARAVTALGVLSNNLDLLKQRQQLSNQEFEKGTSLTEEFNVKNTNLAANLEKISKWFTNMVTSGPILNFISTVVEGFAKWAGIIRPVSADLEENKTKLIGLTIELDSNNTSSERRREILVQLKKEYPGYLGHIDTETEKNADLLPILEKINEQYILRIAYQKRMEKLDDAIKDEAEGINDVYDARQKLILGVAKVQEELAKDGIKFTIKGANEQEKAFFIYKNLNNELRKQAKTNSEVDKHLNSNKYDLLIGNVNKYGNEVKATTENLNDYKKSRVEIENEAKKFKDSAGDLGEKPNVQPTKTGPSVPVKKDTSIGRRIQNIKDQIASLETAYKLLDETDKKGLADNVRKRRDLEKQLEQISGSTKDPKKQKLDKDKQLFNEAEQEQIASLERTAQLIMDAYSKELSEVDEHFRKLQKKYSINKDAVAQIEQERVAKLKQINEKFLKEDMARITAIQNEISQLATSAITRDTDRQLAELKESSRLKIAQLDKEDSETRDRISKQKNSIESLKKVGKNDEAKILQDAVARELAILDESGKLREQFLKNQGLKEQKIKTDAAGNKKLSQLEADVINANSDGKYQKSIAAQIAVLDYLHQVELQKAEETGADVAEIDAKYLAEKKRLQEDYANQQKEMAIDLAQKASDTVFSIMSNSRRAESDATISQIEKERETELSNKNLTDKQKEAINKKYDEKVKKEKERAWKAEQRAAITQALINGALAVTKVLSQTGILAAFALPPIIAATVAEVAVIATQKMPQFEHGGYSAVDYDTEEKSKPSGYVRRPTLFSNSSSGRPFIAGEGYKTEYIVSSDQLKNPVIADFVSAIEDVRGVRRFEYGGYSGLSTTTQAVSPTFIQPTSPTNFDTKVLEAKMDQFIVAANQAWSYKIFEERQNDVLEARKNASA